VYASRTHTCISRTHVYVTHSCICHELTDPRTQPPPPLLEQLACLACVYVCVCVCVRERESMRERATLRLAWYTCERIMAHMRMSHGTHANESRHTYHHSIFRLIVIFMIISCVAVICSCSVSHILQHYAFIFILIFRPTVNFHRHLIVAVCCSCSVLHIL